MTSAGLAALLRLDERSVEGEHDGGSRLTHRQPEPSLALPLLARCRRTSSARDGQDRHHLHGFARENCEVRVVFEKLGGRLV